MGVGSRELVAADESTLVTETLLDAILMKDGESNGCFSDPPWTDESDWSEIFSEIDDLLDQLGTSETGSWRRRRRFPKCTRYIYQAVDSLVVEVADLVWT